MEQLIMTCHKCGGIDFVELRFAGPHIKAVCSHCNSYLKFVEKSLLPDVREIKMKIMVLANSDIELINKAKSELGIFYNGIIGLDAKIAYYRLYVLLHKQIKS